MRLKDIQHPLCCYKMEKNIYKLVNYQMLEPSINSIYCGRIKYSYNKMIYLETGKEVHSQEELINEVIKWTSNLEYPADAYDYSSFTTEKIRVNHKIQHFLYNKLGCKFSFDYGKPFVLQLNSMLRDSTLCLDYEIEDTSSNPLITFYVSNLTDNSFCKIKGDFDTAVTKLKSTLYSIGLCGLSETFKMVNATNVDSIDLNSVECFKPSNNLMGAERVDFKEQLINQLEDCLKQLKNEQ